VRTQKLAIFMK